ncbi:4Fe-4S dicluster domain-containing protein [Aneurinibacillus sp. BA2021]|nr:4Fe-4S dicluster domain-containing protein [Aneurinibacillus sp. BA2021]
MKHTKKTRTDMAPLELVQRTPSDRTFIAIIDPKICRTQCIDKPCTYFCPSQVYQWRVDHIEVDQQRCIECGAAVMGCPYHNINWEYPPGGTGVMFRRT